MNVDTYQYFFVTVVFKGQRGDDKEREKRTDEKKKNEKATNIDIEIYAAKLPGI